MSDLNQDAKHQDWMEKIDEVIHQLELLNQNLAGIALVAAAVNESVKGKAKKKN